VGGELLGELLGDRHEPGAGVGDGSELDGHGHAVVTSSATGTPLVSMS
jgi:hypothetical protein